MTAIPVRRLPVLLVLRRSFLYAWESRAILAGPYAIYVAITVLADLIASQVASNSDIGPILLLNAAEEILAVAFAVGVHRFVLLREAPPGWRFFRWDHHFVQYLLTSIMLLLLAVTAALPALRLAGEAGSATETALSFLFASAFAVFAGLTLIRLSMSLPSAALGDGTRFRTIWMATQGNSVRLLFLLVLILIPFALPEAVLLGILPPEKEIFPFGPLAMAVQVVRDLIAPLQWIVVMTMLALSYDVLLRGGGPPTTHPAESQPHH